MSILPFYGTYRIELATVVMHGIAGSIPSSSSFFNALHICFSFEEPVIGSTLTVGDAPLF